MNRAVHCNSNYGPHMGDLAHNSASSTNSSNKWWYSNNYHYPKMEGIPGTFTVEDYEVFQVIKK